MAIAGGYLGHTYRRIRLSSGLSNVTPTGRAARASAALSPTPASDAKLGAANTVATRQSLFRRIMAGTFAG